MNVFLSKWIMYYEIHRMYREDYSVSRISRELLLNRRTVTNYLSMSESQYELFLINQYERKKELQPFEEFVKTRLGKYRDTSAAQMHDWLKEKHSDFPPTSPKTIYNFEMWVRQMYNLPKISPAREYMIVDQNHHPENYSGNLRRTCLKTERASPGLAWILPYASIYGKLRDLDGWIRNRLRYCIWHNWKKPDRKRKNLIRLGVDQEHVYAWSRIRLGDWAVAQSPILVMTITLKSLRLRGYEAMLTHYEKVAPHLNEPLYTRLVRTVV